jgi:hypothetical protein
MGRESYFSLCCSLFQMLFLRKSTDSVHLYCNNKILRLVINKEQKRIPHSFRSWEARSWCWQVGSPVRAWFLLIRWYVVGTTDVPTKTTFSHGRRGTKTKGSNAVSNISQNNELETMLILKRYVLGWHILIFYILEVEYFLICLIMVNWVHFYKILIPFMSAKPYDLIPPKGD